MGDGELNIGYWILLEHLRKGYASEAVRAAAARRLARIVHMLADRARRGSHAAVQSIEPH